MGENELRSRVLSGLDGSLIESMGNLIAALRQIEAINATYDIAHLIGEHEGSIADKIIWQGAMDTIGAHLAVLP